MKKFLFAALFVIITVSTLESCSSKLCPAYNSYPEGKARR